MRLDSYTEASPSGTGVHILVKAVLPAGGRKKDKVEMYSEGRFFTVSGEHLGGTPTMIEERTAELAALHVEVFGKPQENSQKHARTGNGAANGYTNSLSDEELILLARRAKNGELFARLWSGDTTGYPSASEADQALANLLAFYCGPNPARIDRLFRQSGLYREKWDKKHFGDGRTYGEATIAKALAGGREFYSSVGSNGGTCEQSSDAQPEKRREEQAANSQKASRQGLPLTSLKDLLNEPEEEVDWLVDKTLPARGFSLLVAKPKAGKSTLARNLALAVAQGRAFFGKPTQHGPVIYLALEEKRSEVKKHFRDMGATGEEEIYVFAASAPTDALQQIRVVAEEKKPVLIVIDPLFRLTRVKDGNDYAQVTAALEPLLVLARETGAHVLCVHHAGKGEREGGDSILGSTAIFAAVDTALMMKRTDRYRTISSQQRYGEDLPEMILRFDTQTRTITLGETKEREDTSKMKDALVGFLEGQDEPLSERDIKEGLEGNNRHKQTALRELVEEKKVSRTGAGKKGDPYLFSLAHSSLGRKCESENFESKLTPREAESYSHFETSEISPEMQESESGQGEPWEDDL